MTEQRELIDNPHRTWVLSEEARRTGLAGVRRARAALASAGRGPSAASADEGDTHRSAA